MHTLICYLSKFNLHKVFINSPSLLHSLKWCNHIHTHPDFIILLFCFISYISIHMILLNQYMTCYLYILIKRLFLEFCNSDNNVYFALISNSFFIVTHLSFTKVGSTYPCFLHSFPPIVFCDLICVFSWVITVSFCFTNMCELNSNMFFSL